MKRLANLTVKIFADGADLAGMLAMAKNPLVKGFTTNPSLMRKAGVADYESFAREVIAAIPDRPISFEIFADEFAAMIAQGRKIGSWGPKVYVKVPVTDTAGRFSGEVISVLSREGIALNVTAIMTLDQVRAVAEALAPDVPAIVSVFAGRIADTGRDPVPHMRACLEALKYRPRAELLWASSREVLNLFQADEIGCHIITMTNDLIDKLVLYGRDLVEYSRDTVQTFFKDAAAAGYQLRLG
jgi:transaldolase